MFSFVYFEKAPSRMFGTRTMRNLFKRFVLVAMRKILQEINHSMMTNEMYESKVQNSTAEKDYCVTEISHFTASYCKLE